MEKTESINLGGSMFVVEEDAYAILSDYLDRVREHIGSDVDADEVMGDIEISMSEKLGEKLNEQKRIVDKKDVEELIGIMGTVEDFQQNFGGEEKDEAAVESKEAIAAKKLYRDMDGKLVAGVCSGIAAYFSKDPFIVRALFLLLFIFGNGIALPIYLALWIIIPSAKTTAQRLEMEGSPLTLSSIRRTSRSKGETARSGQDGRSRASLGRIISVLTYLFGLFLIIGSLAVMFGTVTGVGIVCNYANGYAFFNDVSISEIKSFFPFYVFLAFSIMIFVIPAFVSLVIGGALVFRKKMVNSAVLIASIAVWMLFGCGVAYIGLGNVGQFQKVFAESDRVQHKTEAVSLESFNSIVASGRYQDVEVRQGKSFALNVEGRKIDLENLSYRIEDGSLVLEVEDREIENDCLACHQEAVKVTVTAPDISKIKVDHSDLLLEGSYDALEVEASYVYLDFIGVVDRLTLNAKSTTVKQTGTSQELVLVLDYTDYDYRGETGAIALRSVNRSNIRLSGRADRIDADLQQSSTLSALDMEADVASLNLSGDSWAAVNAMTEISGKATDESGVCYLNDPIVSGFEVGNVALINNLRKISSYEYAHRENVENAETRYLYDGDTYYEIQKRDAVSYDAEADEIVRIFGA